MKYAWIDKQRNDYELDEICSVLEVSVSGYRSWKRGVTPDRKRLTDAQMLALIRVIHEKFKGAYGSPKMVKELRGRGFPASKERVERLMREHGIHARHKRRYKVTTDSKHNLPDRLFTPSAPNQVWTSAITYPVDRRRLALSGHRPRPVQPRSGGLVTETPHDGEHRDGRAVDGVVPPKTRVQNCARNLHSGSDSTASCTDNRSALHEKVTDHSPRSSVVACPLSVI